jgi:predicted GTPase
MNSKDVTPTMGEGLEQIATSRKSTPIQLTWQDIVITAHPPKGKCCKGSAILKTEKVIIDNVSGTVRPG